MMITERKERLESLAHKAHGFTLVELLVVIAIIGILVALLLPAVQAAREAARRVQCKDNVKNIALGVLLHEDGKKFLPSGGWGKEWSGDPNRGSGADQPGSWIYNILPYVEEGALHDLGSGQNPGSAAFREAYEKVSTTPLQLFQCPSRRAPRLYLSLWGATSIANEFSTLPNLGLTTGLAKSDYAGNSGDSRFYSGDSFARMPNTPPHTYAAAATTVWFRTDVCQKLIPPDPNLSPNFAFCQSGVMYFKSELKLSRITDGTSNTYLLGEKFIDPDGYEGSTVLFGVGFTYGDNQSMYTGYEWDNHRVAYQPGISFENEEYFQPRQDTPGDDNNGRFGSAHPGGFNMAFCDGSVQTISYDINATVHRYLANRFDGQVVDKGNAL
jgi:prepilin-type N-terminal cleavage/methylation domain-containing protein/prepilin-type processing-associated H-X9-DG protein